MCRQLIKCINNTHEYFNGEDAVMQEFAQRWWAIKQVYPDLVEVLFARIITMTEPGPFVPLLGAEYLQVHVEVALIGYFADEKGEGLYGFRMLMQVVAREADELAQVTNIAALISAPSKSKVSRWMEAQGLNSAENGAYRHASLQPPPMAPTREPHRALMAPPPSRFPTPAPATAAPTSNCNETAFMASMVSQWMASQAQRGGGGSQVGTILPSDSASQAGVYGGGGGGGGRGGGGRGGRGGRRDGQTFKNAAGGPWVAVWRPADHECWKCGATGHRGEACQIPQSGQKCQGCGLVGHISPVCPTNKRCL